GQRVEFTAAADGDCTLAVEHLHLWGGPEETYHLTVTPADPAFDLSVGLDRFDAGAGATFAVPVHVTRRGYTGPIEVSVAGHPALSGRLPVAANPPPTPAVPAGTLTVTVKPDAPQGPLTFRIDGKATVGGKPVVAIASHGLLLRQAMANLPYPPPEYETQ